MEPLLVRVRIVVFDLVVAFVLAEFPNNLDLASQYSFFARRVDGIGYGRDTFPGG